MVGKIAEGAMLALPSSESLTDAESLIGKITTLKKKKSIGAEAESEQLASLLHPVVPPLDKAIGQRGGGWSEVMPLPVAMKSVPGNLFAPDGSLAETQQRHKTALANALTKRKGPVTHPLNGTGTITALEGGRITTPAVAKGLRQLSGSQHGDVPVPGDRADPINAVPDAQPMLLESAAAYHARKLLEKKKGASEHLSAVNLLTVQQEKTAAQQHPTPSDTQTSRNDAQSSAAKALKQWGQHTSSRKGERLDPGTIRMDYQFQRWSGDHSVKVSLQRDAMFDGNLILQPSDTRAADALERQIASWPKQTPEILDPNRGDEKDQRRGQHDEQEEDQQ